VDAVRTRNRRGGAYFNQARGHWPGQVRKMHPQATAWASVAAFGSLCSWSLVETRRITNRMPKFSNDAT
jgi:hypothetical protein